QHHAPAEIWPARCRTRAATAEDRANLWDARRRTCFRADGPRSHNPRKRAGRARVRARSKSATYPGQRSVQPQPTKQLVTAAGTARAKIAEWDVRDGFELVATLELQSRVVGSRRPLQLDQPGP